MRLTGRGTQGTVFQQLAQKKTERPHRRGLHNRAAVKRTSYSMGASEFTRS
jgi:hypothetical protein